MNMSPGLLSFTTNKRKSSSGCDSILFSKRIFHGFNQSFQMAQHLLSWKCGPNEVITWVACKYFPMRAMHHLQERPVNNPSFPSKSKRLYSTQALFTDGSLYTLSLEASECYFLFLASKFWIIGLHSSECGWVMWNILGLDQKGIRGAASALGQNQHLSRLSVCWRSQS